MPFKTRTEGGSWSGGGTEVPNCNLNERNAIVAAFDMVQTGGSGGNRGMPCLTSIGRLDALINCLRGKTTGSVEIDCPGSGCTAFGTAPLGGNSINLCPLALPPTGNQADCDVTVFHELIHSCNGLEIDSWSLENHCYQGHGTINPGRSTVDGFLTETNDVGGGLRAGRYVVWERATGRVFVKVETGGSWNSGPTISRGTELMVNNSVYMRP